MLKHLYRLRNLFRPRSARVAVTAVLSLLKLILIEGAETVVYTNFRLFSAVAETIRAIPIEIKSAMIIKRSKVRVTVDRGIRNKVDEVINKLGDIDGVENIWTNI